MAYDTFGSSTVSNIMLTIMYYTVAMILTVELVMADDQCTEYQFQSPFYPGKSCEDIYNKNSESHKWPGYYWITEGPDRVYCGMNYTGSSCVDIYMGNLETGDKSGYYRINNDYWTFCNMTEIAAGIISNCAGMGGEWRRIAYININAGTDCPTGWVKSNYSGIGFCRSPNNNWGCYSAYFSTNGTSYQRVCGRARGYQKGETSSFEGGQGINGVYADGLSITYGTSRIHIWTYAAGRSDNQTHIHNCPCAPGGQSPPSFVGNNYYCESGATGISTRPTYYLNDPLWDGSGCITSTCCANRTQPWFLNELGETITSDIEVRLCTWWQFDLRAILIDQLELYIQ